MNLRSCTTAGVRAATLAIALLAAASANAATVDWTTYSPGGMVDAGFSAACGRPVMLDGAGNAVLVRGYAARSLLSIAKFSAGGDLLWRMGDDEPRTHYFPCTATLDAGGNVLVVSAALRDAPGSHKVVTAKYAAADGALLWKVESATVHPVVIGGVAVDPQGDVWMLARGTRQQPLSGSRTVLAKYRGATGEPAWPQRAGGEIVIQTPFYSMLAVDAQGDAVVASTLAAMKYSGSTGDPMWTPSTAGGTSVTVPSVSGAGGALVPNGLLIDAAGDVVLLKNELSERLVAPGQTVQLEDYGTVKLSGATGAPLWTGLPIGIARYDGPAQYRDVATGIALDPSGNVIVHGHSHAGGQTQQDYDFATLKLDGATGAPTWAGGAMRYDGPANDMEHATEVVADAAGDVFVTGTSMNAAGDTDVVTRKYSAATGAPLWNGLADSTARLDGAAGGFDQGLGLAIHPSGDVFVAGSVEAAENDDQRLVRYDGATGAIAWSATSEPDVARKEQLERAQATAVDAHGNTFVAGSSFNGHCSGWLVMKVAPDGTRLWTRRFSAERTLASDGCGAAYALALDAAGDVFVTGDLGLQVATAKLSGVDGAPLWTGLPQGMALHDVGSRAGYYGGLLVKVDGNGDIVVGAGQHFSLSVLHVADFFTIKYSGATGAKQWTGLAGGAAFFSQAGSSLIARELAIDAHDDVFVVLEGPTIGGWGMAMIKYSGGDGTPLWNAASDGATRFQCSGPVLAIDPAQDAVIACTTVYPAPADYVTIKYSGATGRPAWTQRADGTVRYNGRGDANDAVSAIAVDRSGAIYVTGHSTGVGTGWDWTTIKYAGHDGSAAWADGAVHQDGTGFDDFPRAIVLAGSTAFAVAGVQGASSGTPSNAWSLHSARTGARIDTQTISAATRIDAMHVAPGAGLHLIGTADAAQADAKIHVTRISGLAIPVFNSSFEANE